MCSARNPAYPAPSLSFFTPAASWVVEPDGVRSDPAGVTSARPRPCAPDNPGLVAVDPNMLLVPRGFLPAFPAGAGFCSELTSSSPDDDVSRPFFRRDFPFFNDSADKIPLRGITSVLVDRRAGGREEKGRPRRKVCQQKNRV
jgi:hypothetical protein